MFHHPEDSPKTERLSSSPKDVLVLLGRRLEDQYRNPTAINSR